MSKKVKFLFLEEVIDCDTFDTSYPVVDKSQKNIIKTVRENFIAYIDLKEKLEERRLNLKEYLEDWGKVKFFKWLLRPTFEYKKNEKRLIIADLTKELHNTQVRLKRWFVNLYRSYMKGGYILHVPYFRQRAVFFLYKKKRYIVSINQKEEMEISALKLFLARRELYLNKS